MFDFVDQLHNKIHENWCSTNINKITKDNNLMIIGDKSYHSFFLERSFVSVLLSWLLFGSCISVAISWQGLGLLFFSFWCYSLSLDFYIFTCSKGYQVYFWLIWTKMNMSFHNLNLVEYCRFLLNCESIKSQALIFCNYLK